MLEDKLKSTLNSVAYMCLQGIDRSRELIGDLDDNESNKIQIVSNAKKLVDRMIINLVEFQDHIERLLNQQPTLKSEDQKFEKLTRLSLIKTRPDSLEDSDIDLNGSIATTLKKNLQFDNATIKDDKDEDDKHSDNETIILDNNFDDDHDNEDEFGEIITKTEQFSHDFHKKNAELLKVLMELPAKQDCAVENAFKSMEELDENSTIFSDTTSSIDTDSESIFLSDNFDSEHRNNDQLSSSSSSKDDDDDNNKTIIADVVIRLKRLDHMNDDEIGRLCNLNNIKKQNCRNVIKQIIKTKNMKRRRIVSSSSSASDNAANLLQDFIDNNIDSDATNDSIISNNTDSDATNDSIISNNTDSDATNDSINSNIDSNSNNIDKIVDSKALLAELYFNENLPDSENESDDESNQSDIEGIKEKRKRNYKSADNQQKSKKKRYSPLRFHIDDSSTFSDTDSDIQMNDKESETKKNNNTNKESENVTIIDDDTDCSDSVEFLDDNDSDLEFISQVQLDQSSTHTGRKHIRRILTDEELTQETQQARLEETQRIQRLEEMAKIKEPLCSQHDTLILDMDVETKTPLIKVDDCLYARLKPHQIDGVKFMWEACYESIDAINDGKLGSGCILAHCMGLGKTYQAITLIHTVLTYNQLTKTKHVLVMCPLSTVLNWKKEFQLAFSLLRSPPDYQMYYIVKENPNERFAIIEKWKNTGGVLIMGYDIFVRLIFDKTDETRRNQLKCHLTNPGPDLVICDEGHLVKNNKTKRTEALMKIKTNRKIILTGTPLQNNLQEYYYMVRFVKPSILGTFAEYTNRFVNPIMNGQFHDSKIDDIKLMKKRTHVLNKLLKKTIHRAESSILKEYLPTIRDYTVFIKLQPIQIDFYRNYINSIRPDPRERQFFNDYRVLQYICLHPYIMQLIKERQNEKKRKELDTINVDEEDDDVVNIPIDWWSNIKVDDLSTNINYGPKLQIIFSIIDECELIGDKVLIFSHSLVELDCIEHFLLECGTRNRRNWIRNVDYFRLDGTISPVHRNNLCDRFNCTTNKTKILLVSQKVGGLGLNLIAANRVILVSTNFNPGFDTQSVYRVYRFGQTKMCFVYRLVTMGTMEEKIYQRCVVKLSLASTVIDKFHIARHVARNDYFNTMYNLDIENYQQHLIPNVPNDRMLANLIQTIDSIFNYNEYQALLENRPEEELNDEEKKLAWEEYNIEETAAKNAEPVKPNATVQRFMPSRPPTQQQGPLQQFDLRNLEDVLRQRWSTIARPVFNQNNVVPSINTRVASISGASSINNNNKNNNNNDRSVPNRPLILNRSNLKDNEPQPGPSGLQNHVINNNNRLLDFQQWRAQKSLSGNKSDNRGFFVRDKNASNTNDFRLNRFFK